MTFCMFNLLYYFLYRYSFFLPNINYFNTSTFTLNNNLKNNLGSFKYNFLIKQNFFINKKNSIFLLKKKYFFFKFINKQDFLVKKLLKDSFKRTNSFYYNKISSCFKTLDSRRPLKNLYYKISRSRSILPFFFQNTKSQKNISFFVKNFRNLGHILNKQKQF